MAIGNHNERFEKEEEFNEIYSKVIKINPSLYMMRDFENVVRLINPKLLEGLFEKRPCIRKLRYIGHDDWPEPIRTEMKDEQHDYFVYGEIYYSVDFTGATYSFEGYVDDEGKPKRIGCAYFEWLKDDESDTGDKATLE